MIQWKLGCRSRKQKRKTQPIARPGIEHCHWFILPLLLATPTMQFSLDRKRRSHKQNQCSASDSVGLIFTRSYHFTLLITTPTTTPSLVKTSLKARYWYFIISMLLPWHCLVRLNLFLLYISEHNTMCRTEINSDDDYNIILNCKYCELIAIGLSTSCDWIFPAKTGEYRKLVYTHSAILVF